jgi:hypothetical protein
VRFSNAPRKAGSVFQLGHALTEISPAIYSPGFDYGAKFQFRPKARNLQKVDFAFCILQLFAVLSTCQLARSKKKILHFAFCIFLRTRNLAKSKRKQQNFAVCKEFLHF